MKGLKNKATSAVKWQFLKIGFSVVINFIYLAIVARYVSQASFGLLAIANGSLAIITFFSEFGFGAALVQKESINKEEISSAFNLTILLSVTIAFIIVVLATPISKFYNEPILIGVIMALGGILLIRGFGIVSNALLIRNLEYKNLFISDVVGMIVGNLIVGALLAINSFEVWSLIGAYLGGAIVSTILKLYLKPIYVRLPSMSDLDDDFRYIIKYGFSLTGVRFVHQMAMQADKLILGKVMTKDIVGLYDKSNYLAVTPLNYYGSALDSVLFSAFSKFQTDKEKLKIHFYSFLSLSLIIFIFVSVTLHYRANDIIRFLLGDDWINGIEIFQILVWLIPFMVVARFSDTYVRSRNLFSASIYVKIVYLVLISSAILLLYSMGILYVCKGMVAAGIVHAILLLNICIRDLNSNWKEFLRFQMRLLIVALMVVVANIMIVEFLNNFSKMLPVYNLIVTGIVLCITGALLILKFPLIVGSNLNNYIANNINLPILKKFIKIVE